MTSFWRNNDVIITSCVQWGPRKHNSIFWHLYPPFAFRITQTQDIFPWWTQHENSPNTHVSAYCRWSLRSTLTYINMKTGRLYIQTAINLQRKCLGNPDCKNMENMLIYFIFIWLNVQAKHLIQTILYHFKWDMALWTWLKCPQYMQRTWWQTVATQHTGLT